MSRRIFSAASWSFSFQLEQQRIRFSTISMYSKIHGTKLKATLKLHVASPVHNKLLCIEDFVESLIDSQQLVVRFVKVLKFAAGLARGLKQHNLELIAGHYKHSSYYFVIDIHFPRLFCFSAIKHLNGKILDLVCFS